MKCRIRFKVLAGTALLLGFIIIGLVLADKAATYHPLNFAKVKIPWLDCADKQPAPFGNVTPQDKIVVVPSLEEEDVSWVAEELPDWQHAIYTVNPSSDEVKTHNLTTPVNKGHEAMAYLTYIINHYNHPERPIPSIVAFLHSHRGGFFSAWHVDSYSHSNPWTLQHLQLDYVKEQGYVNLRCNTNPGCKKIHTVNPHVRMSTFREIMGNTSTPYFSQHGQAAQAVITDPYNVEEPRIWAPCCAQFAVSREQIYKRPLDDYVKIRQWLLETDKDDAASGRIFEYLWHVLFLQEAITCADEKMCYCKTYGKCD